MQMLHWLWSSDPAFNFQDPLISLTSSSKCLRLLTHLPVTSIPPSDFSSITCFRRQFLCKMWPTQLAFLLFNVCQIFLPSLTQFPRDRSNWSPPSFSSTTFLNFPSISDLLSKTYNFQQHTKLYSKCIILLVSSLNFKFNLLVKRFFLLNAALGMGILDFISCVHLASLLSCYQIVEIPHILQLFFIYHNPYWGWLPQDSNYLSFCHIHIHSIAPSNFN